jgi:hypothetical protein
MAPPACSANLPVAMVSACLPTVVVNTDSILFSSDCAVVSPDRTQKRQKGSHMALPVLFPLMCLSGQTVPHKLIEEQIWG